MAWGKLAAECERVKGDDGTLRVFVNTVLGQPWRADEGDESDDSALASRAEAFDLDRTPAEAAFLSGGVDVQGDRLELSSVGHARDGTMFVGHLMLWGAWSDDQTWGGPRTNPAPPLAASARRHH